MVALHVTTRYNASHRVTSRHIASRRVASRLWGDLDVNNKLSCHWPRNWQALRRASTFSNLNSPNWLIYKYVYKEFQSNRCDGYRETKAFCEGARDLSHNQANCNRATLQCHIDAAWLTRIAPMPRSRSRLERHVRERDLWRIRTLRRLVKLKE